MADQEDGLELTEVRLTLGVNLDAAKIAKCADVAQVLSLIKELDDEVGIWAMTILLGRYFEQQMKLASQAVPELFAASDDDLILEMVGELEEASE
jgi:hypothetical protein